MPRAIATLRPAALGALLCSAAVLAGCGQSTQAKQEKIVRCTGFSIALVGTDDGGTTKSDAEALLNKAGITDQDTIPMGAASRDYAAKMDPAKVSRLSQEGGAAAKDLLGRKDAPAIAAYTKDCVATFRSLGK